MYYIFVIISKGKQTLFSPVYGVPYIGHEKGEIIKKNRNAMKEDAERPFT